MVFIIRPLPSLCHHVGRITDGLIHPLIHPLLSLACSLPHLIPRILMAGGIQVPSVDIPERTAYVIVVFSAESPNLFAGSASFIINRARGCQPGSARAVGSINACEPCPKGTYVRFRFGTEKERGKGRQKQV